MRYKHFLFIGLNGIQMPASSAQKFSFMGSILKRNQMVLWWWWKGSNFIELWNDENGCCPMKMGTMATNHHHHHHHHKNGQHQWHSSKSNSKYKIDDNVIRTNWIIDYRFELVCRVYTFFLKKWTCISCYIQLDRVP